MPGAATQLDSQSSLLWMRRALELARQGTALASPNPMVGAVLVRNGKVVGEGFHTYAERAHAEVKAIEQARDSARGATLYINLEPCCHTGRTGPCTGALIAAGVSRVVAAMEDPNPQVSGKGFAQLRQAGIQVEVGPLREEAQRLNEAFAKFKRSGLPLLTLKSAMTLDGKLAAPDDNSGWITSELSRAHVQQQRHEHDAVLTGIGTVLADRPRLTDRTGLARRRPLLRVVMDSRLRLPLDSPLLEAVQDDLLVFCSSAAEPSRRKQLEARGAQVCVAPSDTRPDLRFVLEELARREILSVLLEAGPWLNGAALEAGLVDKVFLYYAPKLLIASDAPTFAGGPGIRALRDALPVRNARFHQFGEDFAIEGYLRDIYGPAQ